MRLNRSQPTTILDEEGVPVDWELIWRLHENVLRKYRPERTDIKGVLFRADPADETIDGLLGRNLGWAGIFGSGLEVVSVTGDHLSMIWSTEHNAALAKSMNAALKRMKPTDICHRGN